MPKNATVTQNATVQQNATLRKLTHYKLRVYTGTVNQLI